MQKIGVGSVLFVVREKIFSILTFIINFVNTIFINHYHHDISSSVIIFCGNL